MIKNFIRAAGLATAVAFAAPAFAGGVTVSDTDSGKLKLGGKAFISGTSATTKTPVSSTTAKSFNVDRFYIEAKYYINDVWMARFTSDVSNETANLPTMHRKSNIFLKYAYIEGKFSDELQLRLGLSHTPWIDYEQGLWKHRFVAKVGSDHYGFDDSADYGIGLKGSLVDGMVDYWVVVVNGGGYGNPTNTNNTFDYNARLTVHPIKGADISAQYRMGYRNAATNAAAGHQKLYQVMASYGEHNYRVGANYMNRKTGDINPAKDATMSLWGWAKFAEQFGAFARYDDNKATPAAGVATHNKRYVVGGEFFAAKGMTYSLAYTGTNNTATSTKVTTIGLYSEFKW